MKSILVASLVVTSIAAASAPQPAAPPVTRRLIIHADDLGMSHAVNRATFEALEHGWITSSSILVPCPWFPEVAAWARAHPDADLGIHLALNSEWTTFRWGPLAGRSAVPSLVDADGYMALDEDAVVAHATPEDAERELRAQVDFAKAHGVHLTHLDSHMGTLFHSQPLFDVYRRMGTTYGLPLLMERLGVRGGAESRWNTHDIEHALIDRLFEIEPGVPADQWEATYEKILAPLPAGTYQVIVHLGYDGDEMQGATADHPNWGSAWRQHDFDMVRSARFQQFLRDQHFTLTTWKEIAKGSGESNN
ncbi:MAG TPA: polysaccharide deacetylase family protein [Vicinamibacterales bacterium]|jgi:predicted glycoside hydrolase/deacetylase ChbG (UPF0249 family)|nr:polysaccharide deacetylase family protein [Vicinamibacterales bacterium]